MLFAGICFIVLMNSFWLVDRFKYGFIPAFGINVFLTIFYILFHLCVSKHSVLGLTLCTNVFITTSLVFGYLNYRNIERYDLLVIEKWGKHKFLRFVNIMRIVDNVENSNKYKLVIWILLICSYTAITTISIIANIKFLMAVVCVMMLIFSCCRVYDAHDANISSQNEKKHKDKMSMKSYSRIYICNFLWVFSLIFSDQLIIPQTNDLFQDKLLMLVFSLASILVFIYSLVVIIANIIEELEYDNSHTVDKDNLKWRILIKKIFTDKMNGITRISRENYIRIALAIIIITSVTFYAICVMSFSSVLYVKKYSYPDNIYYVINYSTGALGIDGNDHLTSNLKDLNKPDNDFEENYKPISKTIGFVSIIIFYMFKFFELMIIPILTYILTKYFDLKNKKYSTHKTMVNEFVALWKNGDYKTLLQNFSNYKTLVFDENNFRLMYYYLDSYRIVLENQLVCNYTTICVSCKKKKTHAKVAMKPEEIERYRAAYRSAVKDVVQCLHEYKIKGNEPIDNLIGLLLHEVLWNTNLELSEADKFYLLTSILDCYRNMDKIVYSYNDIGNAYRYLYIHQAAVRHDQNETYLKKSEEYFEKSKLYFKKGKSNGNMNARRNYAVSKKQELCHSICKSANSDSILNDYKETYSDLNGFYKWLSKRSRRECLIDKKRMLDEKLETLVVEYEYANAFIAYNKAVKFKFTEWVIYKLGSICYWKKHFYSVDESQKWFLKELNILNNEAKCFITLVGDAIGSIKEPVNELQSILDFGRLYEWICVTNISSTKSGKEVSKQELFENIFTCTKELDSEHLELLKPRCIRILREIKEKQIFSESDIEEINCFESNLKPIFNIINIANSKEKNNDIENEALQIKIESIQMENKVGSIADSKHVTADFIINNKIRDYRYLDFREALLEWVK